jgi:hypothetical protein
MKIDLDKLFAEQKEDPSSRSIDLDTILSSSGSACDSRPLVRVGVPYIAESEFNRAILELGAPALISAGALFRNESGLQSWPRALWSADYALDSGGFVAMLQGGYRWTPEEYVSWIMSHGGGSEGSSRPFPFAWWSAMDYCCEQEIAKDREEVLRRIDLTVASYSECLSYWLYYAVDEGFGTEAPEPMMIVQGRRPDDYISCLHRLADERTRWMRSRSASGLSHIFELFRVEEEDGLPVHPSFLGVPSLIGVGSVCRREVEGPEGVIPIVEALDQALPAYTRLHLFGVKGSVLTALRGRGLLHRLASVDSMAWDLAAQRTARELRLKGVPLDPGEKSHYNVRYRAKFLRDFYLKQMERLKK